MRGENTEKIRKDEEENKEIDEGLPSNTQQKQDDRRKVKTKQTRTKKNKNKTITYKGDEDQEGEKKN